METTTMKPSLGAGRMIAMLGALVLGVAAFLPWGVVLDLAVRGTEGDGVITLGVAVVTLILLLIRKAPVWISLVLGLIGLAIGIYDYMNMAAATEGLGSVGMGLYLTIAGGALIVVGTIVQMVKK